LAQAKIQAAAGADFQGFAGFLSRRRRRIQLDHAGLKQAAPEIRCPAGWSLAV